jgi:hypothetical protein
VPAEEDARTEQVNLEDVEQMLGRRTTEVVAEPAAVAAPPAAPPSARPEAPRASEPVAPKSAPQEPAPAPPRTKPVPPPLPKAAPKSTNPEERPLFEGDVDEILGGTVEPEEPERVKKPAPTSGMDALSMGEPARQIVLSAQKVTLLMVVVVVLMALAFAAGYFLAPKG